MTKPDLNEPGMEMAMHSVTLSNDFGEPISFTGRLVAENSHFDEKKGVLTNEKLYKNDEGVTAYSVVSAGNDEKERRAYVLEEGKDGRVVISNGKVALPADMDELLLLLALACEAQERGQAEVECSRIVSQLKAANE